MSAKDGMGEPIPEGVSGSGNVLLRAPAEGGPADGACTELLREGKGGPLLFVTLSEAPDERLAAFRSHGGGDRESVGFVAAGDTVRSAASRPRAPASPVQGPTVRAVPDPADLTAIGVRTSELLAELGGDDRPVSVCVHSVSTLLEHVEPREVFRFLHVLTRRIEEGGANAHYHVDPSAHDQQVLRTLEPLFDVTLAFEDGAWTTRPR